MPEFEPVAEAKRLVGVYKLMGGILLNKEGAGYLIDYIDALTAALREAGEFIDDMQDEADADCGSILHTIRHLLED